MSELKPFGDVPQRLALPLKRSFIATRAYAQSLGKASEVVTNLIHVSTHIRFCVYCNNGVSYYVNFCQCYICTTGLIKKIDILVK